MAEKLITGFLPHDLNRNAIPLAAKLQFEDGTGTPVVSPKTAVGTTPQAFVVPAKAVSLTFRTSADARYGDNATLDGSGTGKGYKTASGGSDVFYPCANAGTVYIRAETGTVTVEFLFEMLN